MKKIYLIVLLTISIALFLPLLFSPSLHGDNPRHLFKVHRLMEDGWKPWIKDWYAGFPFMRFYPSMSYLTAAFLGHILKSHIRGYAATLMVTSFLGALSLHTYLKKTGRDPYIAPVVFLLFPWLIWIAYFEGNFPRANAINLSPLFLLSVYFIAEHREIPAPVSTWYLPFHSNPSLDSHPPNLSGPRPPLERGDIQKGREHLQGWKPGDIFDGILVRPFYL